MKDHYPQSRILGFYVVLGDDMAAIETLVIAQHPNGTITAHPQGCPEVVVPMIPGTLENVRRMHDVANFERWRKKLA